MNTAQRLLIFLHHLSKALRLYFAGIIAIFGTLYLFVGVEQGIDVVIIAGESFLHGLFSFIGVCYMSYVLWFSSRMLSYIRQKKDDSIYGTDAIKYNLYAIPTSMHRHIPRLLAFNSFVIIQIAVFHLSSIFVLSGGWLIVLFALHNILYALLSYHITRDPISRRKFPGTAALILVVAFAGFLLFEIFSYSGIDVIHDPGRHAFWLPVLSLLLFGCQVASVFFFIQRRKKIDQEVGIKKTLYKRSVPFFLKAGPFGEAEAGYYTVFNAIGLFGAGIYLAAVFYLQMSAPMGPMAFAFLAFAVLAGAANRIVVVNIRYDFNLFMILLALSWIIGTFSNPYVVRLKHSKSGASLKTRPMPQEFLKKWFDDKIARHHPEDLNKADSTKKYEVYIVLSNGGASRAGQWVSSVLSHLQDGSVQADRTDPFSDHILSIAGASGGSVGNCAFYSLLKESLTDQALDFSKHSKLFFESDFLTFTLARFLGPDIVRHLFPIRMDDRAAALERLLSNSNDPVINTYFDLPLTEVFDCSGRLPALYINSTQVDNGLPGVISSVRLSQGSLRTDMLGLLDSINKTRCCVMMRLSTAAVLSSRFPYVSPAGKLFDKYFVDGGYFDNSGAGTILEFIGELSKFMNQQSSEFKNSFSFHIIHLNNAEVIPRPPPNINPVANDLLAPLLTLAGTQGASTSISDYVLQNSFKLFTKGAKNSLIRYDLYDTSYNIKHVGAPTIQHRPSHEPGYPMSWVISKYQFDRMEKALKRYQTAERDWFEFSKR